MMREDVALLNHSLDNLGNTFRQTRLDKQNVKQQDLENQMREKMLGVQQERANKATEHEKKMLEKQDSILKHQQAQDAIRQLEKAFSELNDGVARGSIKPEQANASAKRIVERMKQGMDEILQNSPFAAMADDPNAELFSGTGKSNLPTEWERDPNKEYVTRAGAVVPPRKDNVPKVSESETVTQKINPAYSSFNTNVPPTLSLTNRTTRTTGPLVPPKPPELQPIMGRRAMVDNESPISLPQQPPISTPANGAGISLPSAQPEPAPTNPAQRVAGKVYQTPKGLFIWTGQGWKPAQ